MEQLILQAAIQSREDFDKLEHFQAWKDLSDKSRIIWDEVKDYYSKDEEAGSVETEIIRSRLERKYPKFDKLFSVVFDNIGESKLSTTNIIREAGELRKKRLELELSQGFASGRDREEIRNLYNEYCGVEVLNDDNTGRDDVVYSNLTLDNLLAMGHTGEKIKVAPSTLTDYLDGGMIRSEHAVVFGRPEMGKTTFIINLLYGFNYQGLKTLYINNEDPLYKIIRRYYQRVLGITKFQLDADLHGAQSRMERTGFYDKLIVAPVPEGTLDLVERLVKEYKPDVVVVDQMRNLSIGRSENRVLELEIVARSLRKIAKKYNLLMISVTQAGESAEGRKVLRMSDIDWSNTGIQGAVDLMIGIGADDTQTAAGYRTLSFPKNKISGRHDPIQVAFNTETGVIK